MQVEQKSDGAIARSSLRMIEIDPLTDPRWEALMKDSPTSVIYQHPAWLRVLEEAYGYKPLHLACEDGSGQLQGILPLFSRWGVRTGHLSTSVFDSPIAGPLASNEQASTLLIQAAIERTRLEHGSQFQMKVLSTGFDQLVDQVCGVPLFETYELALPEHPDRLRLNSRIKWAVNKATRLGVRVRPAETERDLRVWYELYLQTMRHLVAIPKPYRFFQAAWRHLHPRGLLQLLLAEHVEAGSSRIISGFLFLQWGPTISHIFTGWRREDQALRPNDLLHWYAIREASSQGLHGYDFGNVRVGDQGLAQFKSKWGAEAKLIYRYAYPTTSHHPAAPRTITSHPTPTIASQAKGSAIRQRISSLWQHLPLKTIELIGNGCTTLHYY
jgi:Acetyltransferase (GNAT) domain